MEEADPTSLMPIFSSCFNLSSRSSKSLEVGAAKITVIQSHDHSHTRTHTHTCTQLYAYTLTSSVYLSPVFSSLFVYVRLFLELPIEESETNEVMTPTHTPSHTPHYTHTPGNNSILRVIRFRCLQQSLYREQYCTQCHGCGPAGRENKILGIQRK